MKFKWFNAQLIKQNETEMCRLREDWAQWIDIGLILLKSVLLFQMDYRTRKVQADSNTSKYTKKLAAFAFQATQIGGRSAFLFSTKELLIIIITFAIYR